MRHPEHIKAEQERVRILQFMLGRKLSSKEIREGLGLTKGQLSHHLTVLLSGKYIVKEHYSKNNYLYKRTRQTYIPKKIDPPKDADGQSDMLIEDTLEIKPVSPYARVVRLLKNPLAPAPKNKNRGSLYGGIQSGMGLFALEG